MSKFDHGKHPKNDDGTTVLKSKRLDPQKTPKQLAQRLHSFSESMKVLKSDQAKGFNKPGSQQKRSK